MIEAQENVICEFEGLFWSLISDKVVKKFMINSAVLALLWGAGGSLNYLERVKLNSYLLSAVPSIVDLPRISADEMLIDFEVRIEDGEWYKWKLRLPKMEKIGFDFMNQKSSDFDQSNSDLVIETVETKRHQDLLTSWLSEQRPFILCGLPGSGKVNFFYYKSDDDVEHDIEAAG